MAQGGEFVSFLPGDNQDLASASTQSVIELISQDLSQLLRLPPQQFWQVVLTDKSLQTCLDSFLRFRRRCYDESPESIQGSSDLLLQLSQRVFRVFWRMVHPQELQNTPSQQQAPKGPAGPSKPQQQQQQQQLSPSKAAEQLYSQWLLDVPKMLDLAVLYAPGNAALTGQLLQQLLRLQPKYAQDIVRLAEPLSGNLHELADNVKRLAHKALAAAGGAPDLLQELAEAVKYFTDAFLTLQAFVDCLPAAAALLLNPQNHGAVLLALAVVYSSVLPLLQRISQQPEASGLSGLQPGKVLTLQQCLVSLVFHMLRAAFCTAAGAAVSGGPEALAAAAAAAAAAGPSSSSSSSKGAPPGFSGRGQAGSPTASFSAEIQGQELMNLLMLLAHPSDHQYQQGPGSSAHDRGGLLAVVNHEHHLDVAVAAAMEQGLLVLDDAQFDYLLALVDGDRDLLSQRQQQHQQQHAAAAASSSSSSSTTHQAPAAASSSSSSSQLPPAATLAAQVQSIKELLPDYGDGFLTAALFYNSWSTEQAINCLLEGSLPKGLQSLEPSLKTWAPPASGQAGSASSQAHARLSGPLSGPGQAGSALSWTGLAREAAAAAAAAPPAAANIPLPSIAQAAVAGPKPSVDRRTGRVLGALPSQVRSATKSIAYELQYEYDDEYDDSFDDLAGPGNDGVCDIEGDGTAGELQGGKRAGAAGGSSGQLGQFRAAAAADEYNDEPAGLSRGGASSSSSSRPPGQQQQQQQQRGRQQKGDKLWVLDGKIYNYKREGAQEVAGQAGADKALKAAKAAAQEIMGLGPGGNVPLQVADDGDGRDSRGSRVGGTGRAAAANGGSSATAAPAAAARAAMDGGRTGAAPGATDGAAGGGRGQGGRGGSEAAAPGAGRGRGSYAHKEQHKAAHSNHHRRDRALNKMAKGML